ncbi:helix-turn-helix domain-containing protein [Streptomyces virginiae]|uniref:helix-turn-helix domain-containing protein n=1 Tax=Streptomyces virginiae TaxID=1961 RepID=UPI003691696D
MLFEQHPLDLDLVSFFDQRNEGKSESVGIHVRNCEICTIRLHRVAPNNSNLLQSKDDAVVVKSLVSIALDGKNLHSLVSLFNGGRVLDPQPGQLWRLHWEDVTHLALIASTVHGNLTFWPVTLDVQLADESALLVPASESGGMELELAVWPALETGIGSYVLERYITNMLPPERLRHLRRAYRTGDELPVRWMPGMLAAGPESPRGAFRADLIQVAGSLGEARWEPEDWAESEISNLPSLAEALSAAGISATRLSDELGIIPRRAISLCRGLAEPTPQELDRLHGAFGLSTSGQVGTPSRDVIAALDDPNSRDLILRAAAVEGKSEISLRRDLAQSHFALASRKSGASENSAFEMLATELRKRIAASRESES